MLKNVVDRVIIMVSTYLTENTVFQLQRPTVYCCIRKSMFIMYLHGTHKYTNRVLKKRKVFSD
jgi:hypothetical protein